MRAIEVRAPNVVVLDLALGDGSGLDLLGRLRAADGLASRTDPDLPIGACLRRVGGLHDGRASEGQRSSRGFSAPLAWARDDRAVAGWTAAAGDRDP
jgi:hypothetical protein